MEGAGNSDERKYLKDGQDMITLHISGVKKDFISNTHQPPLRRTRVMVDLLQFFHSKVVLV